MDQTSLLLLLLVIVNVCLHGNHISGSDQHRLQCVNDCLFTFRCSLTSSDVHGVVSLKFTDITQKKFLCRLTNVNGSDVCSVRAAADNKPRSCSDTDVFEISLCHDRGESCQLLVEEHRPAEHVQPNAPTNLSVSRRSGRHHFTWMSSYEAYGPLSFLKDNLKYELQFYATQAGRDGRRPQGTFSSIVGLNFTVEDAAFVPRLDYAARVRSGPGRVSYEGQWSHWSSEVHWRSSDGGPPAGASVPGQVRTALVSVFVTLLLVLLLCYALFEKWREGTFIPTPEPYFQALYCECRGDFKSWVDTRANTPLRAEEEPFQIDTLLRRADVQEDRRAPWGVTSSRIPLTPGAQSTLQQGRGPPSSDYCTLSVDRCQTEP